MRPLKFVLVVLVVAFTAFATGWAFRAYLAPEAIVDMANRVFFCN